MSPPSKLEYLRNESSYLYSVCFPGSVCVSCIFLSPSHVPHMHMGMCTCLFMKECATKIVYHLTFSILVVQKSYAQQFGIEIFFKTNGRHYEHAMCTCTPILSDSSCLCFRYIREHVISVGMLLCN